MNSEQAIGLASLVANVKESLQRDFAAPVWIIAEIMEININRSGHCYLELIEKDTLSDKIIAKSRATIWSYTFRMIKPYFETSTGESLKAGLKVLIRVNVEFHEVYGFSLNIQDIDPQYTLGDMARQRAQVIEQLKRDGILVMNRQIPFPLVPQHIAVVSSDSAAGWGDFSNQLQNNGEGYDFQVELFMAIMQGDKAAPSIIDALNVIFSRIDDFDVVVIIRGGGSKSDLLCFDNYDLASHIAQFPIPVLTGVGHERDDSVADLVAHTRLKTPTAVAEFLINKVAQFHQQLVLKCDMVFESALAMLEENQKYLDKITQNLEFSTRQIINNQQEYLSHTRLILQKTTRQYLSDKQKEIAFLGEKARMVPVSVIRSHHKQLEQFNKEINISLNQFFLNKNKSLKHLESELKLLDPAETLKRGYAIVRNNKKIIKNTRQVVPGDSISIQVCEGQIEGRVEKIIQQDKK